MSETSYIVDTNFFILYCRDLLPPDLFPMFWDKLKDYHLSNKWTLLECVKKEILCGNDFLVEWIKDPSFSVISEFDQLTINSYKMILDQLRQENYYEEHVLANYANCADSWLVAYAHAHNAVIVTREVPNLKKKSRVKIPDVANTHQVRVMTINEYMRHPDIAFRF